MPHSVLIVEDDLRLRASLAHAIRDAVDLKIMGEADDLPEGIEAGAAGYLLKGSSPQDIVAQIRSLVAGSSPISPTIARRLLRRFTGQRDAEADAPTLSTQEQAVLSMSAKGYSYDEIAAVLKLSPHTVETHVKSIYRKLHLHSKTAAVHGGSKLGLIDD